MKTFSTLLLFMALTATAARAQSVTTATYQVGFGSTEVLDTYLSQEKFTGAGLTVLATRERENPDRHWTTLVEHELTYAAVDDRSETCSELQGDYTLLIGRLRHWQIGRLRLQAGAMGRVNLGFIYNTSNSNNPAQGRFSLQAMPTGTASYTFKLLKKTARLRYELQLPLAGIMFSPNYGQSYYEIFSLGNYDHNIVPTTFISAPNLRQQLSLDWTLGSFFTLRVGYLGNYQQASVNNLKSHIYQHRLMIGLVRKFSITKHRP